MPPPARFFSPKECQILLALAACMVGTEAMAAGKIQVAAGLDTMDTYMAGLPSGLQSQFRRTLRLFEWSPVLFIRRPRTFTRLSLRDQEVYVRTWAESRLALRRRAFRALRDLAFLGHYSQAALRELIGHREDESWGPRDDNPGI